MDQGASSPSRNAGAQVKWPDAISAALRRLSRLGFLADGQNCHQTSADDCPTAQITATTPLPDVRQRLALRAHRLHNRDPRKAALYLERHKTLAKGVLNCE